MYRHSGQRTLEAAAKRYRKAAEAMRTAPEGSEHWTARRRLARAQHLLEAAALSVGSGRRTESRSLENGLVDSLRRSAQGR